MSDAKLSDPKSPPDLSMDEILASIRRIIAEDDHPAPAAAAASGEPLCLIAGGDDDILELTETVDDSGNVRRMVAPVAPPSEAPAHGAAETEGTETTAVTAVPEAEPTGADDGAVVSEAAVLAASASFAQLADLPPTATPEPASEAAMLGERQLDNLVRELLRPLLRAWLDQNLPPLVERLVKAEIARIVEQSHSPS